MLTSERSEDRWTSFYIQQPLRDIPFHYANIRRSPFMLQYLTAVLERCPEGGTTLETGIGNGTGTAWLALRGIRAKGIDTSAKLVERARYVANMLGAADATFAVGDLFELYSEGAPRFNVIHSQGTLEHFTLPQIQAAISHQICMADTIIISAPSSFYPEEGEFGDERFVTLEGWQKILEPFDVQDIRLYGHLQHGERDHVLAILNGQTCTEKLRAMMTVPEKPFPPGITAIVHTRNEGHRLRRCLVALNAAGVDQLLVCDMESTDDTVAVAVDCGAEVIHHNLISHFDRARNYSALFARYSHIMYVDADEILHPEMIRMLRSMAVENEAVFDGMYIPFNHFFCGHALRMLYPGYTTVRFVRNGFFHFSTQLHGGCIVNGPTAQFPADLGISVEHNSFPDIDSHVLKAARYTTGEAETQFRRGEEFDVRRMFLHAMQDFVGYYDGGTGAQDGVYGLAYSLLSANYRILQHLKLYMMRANAGLLQPHELAVPSNTAEVAALMLEALNQRPKARAAEIVVAREEGTGKREELGEGESAGVVFTGPLRDPSGLAEESRNLVFALELAGIAVHAQSLPWNDEDGLLTPEEQGRFEAMCARQARPGFLHIIQDFPNGWQRHLSAKKTIVRTMFEADRLPPGWAQACNQMDRVWAPTEFGRTICMDSGVEPDNIAVVPGCFDPAPFLAPAADTPLTLDLRATGKKLLLSVFDWRLAKGWQELLRGFYAAFGGKSGGAQEYRGDVLLVLKVWSAHGYSADQIHAQAAQFAREQLGEDLLSDNRVRFVTDKLSRSELVSLYKIADAFALPTHGEGFGRRIAESMLCSVPVVVTNWSAQASFVRADTGFPIDCTVVPVPEPAWRELPIYKGCGWAQPDIEQFARQLVYVLDHPEEARAIAERGRDEVCARFSREAVGKIMREEIEKLMG